MSEPEPVAPGFSDPRYEQEVRSWVGRVVGGCRIESLIGTGGMGALFLARQLSLDRPVALRTIRPDLVDADTQRRLLLATRSAGSLPAAHVVRFFEVGLDQGIHYVTMEPMPGGNLEDAALEAPSERLPVDVALRWTLQAARGLLAAERQRSAHGDIKPGNLLLDVEGRVRMAGFGLAKALDSEEQRTRTGVPLGSPDYLSPEQCEGKEVDHRADIYALGATIYRLVTGRRPVPGQEASSPESIGLPAFLRRRLEVPFLSPRQVLKDRSVPQRLNDLVERMTARDPANRPQSFTAVIDELEALLAAPPAGSSRPGSSASLFTGVRGDEVRRVALDHRYETLELLGSGAMGQVFRARDLRDQREVAVKRILPETADDVASIERFLREARSIERLRHPNVVECYETAVDDTGPWIAMELVGTGRTLKDRVLEEGSLDVEKLLAVAMQLCDALSHAHHRSVLHRDVKPSNVLLAPDGVCKLADFGLARVGLCSTSAGDSHAIGTPEYAAPEVYRDPARVDHRCDIYSLAKTIYFLATAESPVTVRDGRLPAAIRRAVLKALEGRLEDRYYSIEDFRRELLGRASPIVAPVAASVDVCPSCASPAAEGLRFCDACGETLVLPCPRCAKEVRIGRSFCGSCGVDTASYRAAMEKRAEGDAAAKLGEWRRATEAYELALAALPGDPVLRRRRDRCRMRERRERRLAESVDAHVLAGRPEAALRVCAAILARNPSHPVRERVDGIRERLEEQQAAHRRSRIEKSARLLAKCIEARDWEEAEQGVEELRPLDAEAAIRWSRKIGHARNCASIEELLTEARRAADQRRFREAMQLCDQAIEEAPSDALREQALNLRDWCASAIIAERTRRLRRDRIVMGVFSFLVVTAIGFVIKSLRPADTVVAPKSHGVRASELLQVLRSRNDGSSLLELRTYLLGQAQSTDRKELARTLEADSFQSSVEVKALFEAIGQVLAAAVVSNEPGVESPLPPARTGSTEGDTDGDVPPVRILREIAGASKEQDFPSLVPPLATFLVTQSRPADPSGRKTGRLLDTATTLVQGTAVLAWLRELARVLESRPEGNGVLREIDAAMERVLAVQRAYDAISKVEGASASERLALLRAFLIERAEARGRSALAAALRDRGLEACDRSADRFAELQDLFAQTRGETVSADLRSARAPLLADLAAVKALHADGTGPRERLEAFLKTQPLPTDLTDRAIALGWFSELARQAEPPIEVPEFAPAQKLIAKHLSDQDATRDSVRDALDLVRRRIPGSPASLRSRLDDARRDGVDLSPLLADLQGLVERELRSKQSLLRTTTDPGQRASVLEWLRDVGSHLAAGPERARLDEQFAAEQEWRGSLERILAAASEAGGPDARPAKVEGWLKEVVAARQRAGDDELLKWDVGQVVGQAPLPMREALCGALEALLRENAEEDREAEAALRSCIDLWRAALPDGPPVEEELVKSVDSSLKAGTKNPFELPFDPPKAQRIASHLRRLDLAESVLERIVAGAESLARIRLGERWLATMRDLATKSPRFESLFDAAVLAPVVDHVEPPAIVVRNWQSLITNRTDKNFLDGGEVSGKVARRILDPTARPGDSFFALGRLDEADDEVLQKFLKLAHDAQRYAPLAGASTASARATEFARRLQQEVAFRKFEHGLGFTDDLVTTKANYRRAFPESEFERELVRRANQWHDAWREFDRLERDGGPLRSAEVARIDPASHATGTRQARLNRLKNDYQTFKTEFGSKYHVAVDGTLDDLKQQIDGEIAREAQFAALLQRLRAQATAPPATSGAPSRVRAQ